MTTQEHAPVFAYEEVTSEDAKALTEEIAETKEEIAEDVEVIDIVSLSPEDRLKYLQKLAEDNARLRAQTAQLQSALAKASAPTSARARKDPERDAKILTQVVTDIVNLIPEQTTEKSATAFRRYVGSVNITKDDVTKRYHATVVVKEAKRG